MNILRRYEILLPLRFNNGEPVPEDLLADTLLELRRQFGAVSSETQIIQGHWENEGVVFQDHLTRIFMDVPDTPENRHFFVQLKEQLKVRFQQLDIWLPRQTSCGSRG
jgi:hypothetical protein